MCAKSTWSTGTQSVPFFSGQCVYTIYFWATQLLRSHKIAHFLTLYLDCIPHVQCEDTISTNFPTREKCYFPLSYSKAATHTPAIKMFFSNISGPSVDRQFPWKVPPDISRSRWLLSVT